MSKDYSTGLKFKHVNFRFGHTQNVSQILGQKDPKGFETPGSAQTIDNSVTRR